MKRSKIWSEYELEDEKRKRTIKLVNSISLSERMRFVALGIIDVDGFFPFPKKASAYVRSVEENP